MIYEIQRVYSIEQYSKQYLVQVNTIDENIIEDKIFALLDIPYNFDLIPGDIIS